MGINTCMKKVFFLVILFSGLVSLSSYSQDNFKQIKSSRIEKINGSNFYIHTVKKGQTLYMISKVYDVDIDEIIQDNPEIRQGLKSGQKIRIPAPKTVESTKRQSKTSPDENKKTEVSAEGVPIPCGKDRSALKTTYSIALLMPLYLSEVVQMDVNIDPDAAPQENNPLQFVEYYEGFRMAVDSLEKTGISVKVTVYDAERDTMKTFRLLQDPELKIWT